LLLEFGGRKAWRRVLPWSWVHTCKQGHILGSRAHSKGQGHILAWRAHLLKELARLGEGRTKEEKDLSERGTPKA
jgi:hypothetical protein